VIPKEDIDDAAQIGSAEVDTVDDVELSQIDVIEAKIDAIMSMQDHHSHAFAAIGAQLNWIVEKVTQALAGLAAMPGLGGMMKLPGLGRRGGNG